jgi:hypothetical protein
MLSPDEGARYRDLRSQLARGQSAASGAAGTPEPRRLRLGATDGLLTEVVDGDLRQGDRVIIGAESETAKPTWLARL